MPGPQEREQRGRDEWEPDAALMGALEGLSLAPGAVLDGDLAGLKPHLERALEELERLGRRRGLSKREKTRGEALRMLLGSIGGPG